VECWTLGVMGKETENNGIHKGGKDDAAESKEGIL
jgi:hypothetical protein